MPISIQDETGLPFLACDVRVEETGRNESGGGPAGPGTEIGDIPLDYIGFHSCHREGSLVVSLQYRPRAYFGTGKARPLRVIRTGGHRGRE